MFTINALLLVVFAIAFSFAGLGAKDRTYWLYMVASNIVLAVAFFYVFSRNGWNRQQHYPAKFAAFCWIEFPLDRNPRIF